MKALPVPDSELQLIIDLIKKNPKYFDINDLSKSYQKSTKKLINNPFSKDIVKYVVKFLKKQKPMSVIRLGDGEMNLLTYTQYPQLPELSFLTAAESVRKRQHSFVVNKSWLFVFEEMMFTAMKEADLIGVLGLWRPNPLTVDQFLPTLNKNIRGRWGQWSGIDYITVLNRQNFFKSKVLVSAHLYFSLIQHLDEIFAVVKTVYLITNQYPVLNKLSSKYLNNQFILIKETASKRPLTDKEPHFLYNVMSNLPRDMTGTLSLIGAGPWSEFYCTWIKRRGGVAIDIGSGFDLLLGKQLRPVHAKINFNL